MILQEIVNPIIPATKEKDKHGHRMQGENFHTCAHHNLF